MEYLDQLNQPLMSQKPKPLVPLLSPVQIVTRRKKKKRRKDHMSSKLARVIGIIHVDGSLVSLPNIKCYDSHSKIPTTVNDYSMKIIDLIQTNDYFT